MKYENIIRTYHDLLIQIVFVIKIVCCVHQHQHLIRILYWKVPLIIVYYQFSCHILGLTKFLNNQHQQSVTIYILSKKMSTLG